MKLFKLYFPVAAAFVFLLSTQAATAQTSASSQVPPTVAEAPAKTTLSGIDLFPNQKAGTFQLRFTQQLKFTTDTSDVATLMLTDEAGNVVYSNSLNPEVNKPNRPLDVGKLANGIYLIEVQTNQTTYWKKVKVQNQQLVTKTKTNKKRRS